MNIDAYEAAGAAFSAQATPTPATALSPVHEYGNGAERHVELTGKGMAYVAGHIRPRGCPAGVDPRAWRQGIEARIDRHLAIVTGLLSILDEVDGDSDLEPVLGAPERIPAMGWWARDYGCQQIKWADGAGDWHEQVNEDGGDILDEPHDACLDLYEGTLDEDLEIDEPSRLSPNGAHLPGGGSDAA